jgi:hypothetical protein
MKTVQAYRCEHCGKLYLREKYCIFHENNKCRKNPELFPLCYTCEHFEATSETEEVKVVRQSSIDYDAEYTEEYNFFKHKCNVRGCKLFNGIRLSNEVRRVFVGANYKQMPIPRDGGCKDYKQDKNKMI